MEEFKYNHECRDCTRDHLSNSETKPRFCDGCSGHSFNTFEQRTVTPRSIGGLGPGPREDIAAVGTGY